METLPFCPGNSTVGLFEAVTGEGVIWKVDKTNNVRFWFTLIVPSVTVMGTRNCPGEAVLFARNCTLMLVVKPPMACVTLGGLALTPVGMDPTVSVIVPV